MSSAIEPQRGGTTHQPDKDQQINEKLNKILAHVAEMKMKREREEAAARFKYHTDKYGKDNYLPLIDEPLRNGGGSPRNYKSAIVDQKDGEKNQKQNLLSATAALFEDLTNASGGRKQTPRLTSSSNYGIAYTIGTGGESGAGGNNKNNNTAFSASSSSRSPRRIVKPVEPTSLAIGENEEGQPTVPSPPDDLFMMQKGCGRFTYSPRVQRYRQQQQLIEEGRARQNYERYGLYSDGGASMAPPSFVTPLDNNNKGKMASSSSKNKKEATTAPRPTPPAPPSSHFKMGSPRNGFISKTTFSTAFDHCYQEIAKEMAQGGPTPSPRQQMKQRALDSRLPAPQSTIRSTSNPSYHNLITASNTQKEAQEAELEHLRAHVIDQLRQYRTDDEIERRAVTQRDYEFAQGEKSSLPLESDNILKRKRGIRVFKGDEYDVSPVTDLQHQKMRSPKEGQITRRKHIAMQDHLTLRLTKKKNQVEDNSIFAPKNVHLRSGLASIETKGSSPRGVHE